MEVLLLSGMILKQEIERKLVRDFKSSGTIQKQEGKLIKGFISGTTPERIGEILVVISFQEK